MPNSGVNAEVKLPDSFSIALSHSMDRWQFLADYTWTGWDSIQDLSIYRRAPRAAACSSTPLNFKNSWRAGLGVNYQLNPEWKLRGGIAYDTTPVQDAYRTPRLPDQDRTWLSIGAQWTVSKQLAIDFGYAYLFVRDGSSNLPSVETEPALRLHDHAEGQPHRHVHRQREHPRDPGAVQLLTRTARSNGRSRAAVLIVRPSMGAILEVQVLPRVDHCAVEAKRHIRARATERGKEARSETARRGTRTGSEAMPSRASGQWTAKL